MQRLTRRVSVIRTTTRRRDTITPLASKHIVYHQFKGASCDRE